MPDLSNYYTKDEVDNKIIEVSPIKTMTVEKECSVYLEHTGNSSNTAKYEASWLTEYITLNPITITVKFKTLSIKVASSLYPTTHSNIRHGKINSFQNFTITNYSSEFEITDLPNLIVTEDNTTIFSVNLRTIDGIRSTYVAGTAIVTLDLTIVYAEDI